LFCVFKDQFARLAILLAFTYSLVWLLFRAANSELAKNETLTILSLRVNYFVRCFCFSCLSLFSLSLSFLFSDAFKSESGAIVGKIGGAVANAMTSKLNWSPLQKVDI
jgi:hypothetical protein